MRMNNNISKYSHIVRNKDRNYDRKKYDQIKFFDAYYDKVNKEVNINKEKHEDFDDVISSSICADEENDSYDEIEKIDKKCCVIL